LSFQFRRFAGEKVRRFFVIHRHICVDRTANDNPTTDNSKVKTNTVPTPQPVAVVLSKG
jgi:hypothetical protein